MFTAVSIYFIIAFLTLLFMLANNRSLKINFLIFFFEFMMALFWPIYWWYYFLEWLEKYKGKLQEQRLEKILFQKGG